MKWKPWQVFSRPVRCCLSTVPACPITLNGRASWSRRYFFAKPAIDPRSRFGFAGLRFYLTHKAWQSRQLQPLASAMTQSFFQYQVKSYFSAGRGCRCFYFLPFKNRPEPAQTDPNPPYYTSPEAKKAKKVLFILTNDSGGKMGLVEIKRNKTVDVFC